MTCTTCGVYGHESQGSFELCLRAVKERMLRWGKLAGEICGAMVNIKLKHAPTCGSGLCEACKVGHDVHIAAREMAAEDGWV